MRVRALAGAFLVALVSTLAPSTSSAASSVESALIADLEGVPIAATSVSSYFCHDFDHPLIHCFRTADRLEGDVAARTGGAPFALGQTTITAVAYVRIYDLSSYAGAYATLSADYTHLSSIGWANRISSYKGLNSESGAFYTNTTYSGSLDQFCCNQAVPTLSSTFDNQIDSVRRT